MAITGKVGAVYISETAPDSFTDEATTGDAELKRYQVTDPNYRYWPPDEPITVKVNGSPVASGFDLERAGGFVVFEEALEAEDVVTVSGKAVKVAQAGGFFNWSVDGEGDDLDATTFNSGGWREFVSGLREWSGSAEAYWGDEGFFKNVGELVAVKLFIDSGPAQTCLEGFALISSDGIETPSDDLVQESIDFTGVGPLYPRF